MTSSARTPVSPSWTSVLVLRFLRGGRNIWQASAQGFSSCTGCFSENGLTARPQFFGDNRLNQPDRIPLSVRAPLAVSCAGDYLAGGARGCHYCPVRLSHGRCLAADLRRVRRACPLSECLRPGSADLHEGAICSRAGSNPERAAVPRRSTRCDGDLRRAGHFRGEALSRRAPSLMRPPGRTLRRLDQ